MCATDVEASESNSGGLGTGLGGWEVWTNDPGLTNASVITCPSLYDGIFPPDMVEKSATSHVVTYMAFNEIGRGD